MDRLNAQDLRVALGDCALAREIVVLEKTTSTNDIAVEHGRQGAPAGLVVFAETQTVGRGRLGRHWESAPHQGLWFSLLLRPELPRPQWGRLTTWAAVSIAEALDDLASIPHSIKWPNDIFLHGKKIAGILAESGADFVVLGAGVNVNQLDFPPELSEKATSLRLMAGHSFDRLKVAAAVLQRLQARHSQLAKNFTEIVQTATDRSLILGRHVEVSAGSSVVCGLAEALDSEGALHIRAASGELMTVSSGEVTHFYFS